jgi:hypothetical protein
VGMGEGWDGSWVGMIVDLKASWLNLPLTSRPVDDSHHADATSLHAPIA